MDANTTLSGQSSLPPLLEFRDVTVVKDEKKLLDSLTVTIYEGEHVAILGPNGAGKSTFIKAVMREYYPLRGEDVIFRVGGKDVWHVTDLRSNFGIVSNELQYTFTREITGRDVVLSGFFSSIGLWWNEATPEMEQKTDEVLRFLEISHLADRLITTMSSGEARRFLIGRALVHDPKALILDEPTTSLDLHALHTFRATLRKIAQAGTGIIMVTHMLSDIIPETSRIILMKDGKFCGDGPKAKMLTDEHIGGHFGVPLHIREEDGWYYVTGY
ncbi:ATP-binding cassette domain-containing protein [Methanogenium organophilum]|uniref:ATP-binding cassette domain-containing protein n=2 Tax=Methanogenium organophilum TaxID=2199 RepID=A0A9X9S708_METOG|nr:ATP-binding cassette domain-containing protein [Methanogenium organophilum]WAI02587.1 ATP-binding cassette domain-containing protein [Methanogenium organophilum]